MNCIELYKNGINYYRTDFSRGIVTNQFVLKENLLTNRKIVEMKKHISVIIFLIFVFSGTGYTANFLYIPESLSEKEINENIKTWEQYQVTVKHRFGKVMFLRSPGETIPVFSRGDKKIFKVADGFIPETILGKKTDSISELGIKIWNRNYVRPKPEPIERKLKNRILKRPSPPKLRPRITLPSMAAPLLSLPYGATWEDTSEYFLHRVAVGIILMESTGHDEDWTTAERDKVVAETQIAMDWWIAEAPDANLSFVYEVNYGSTDHEPIQENTGPNEEKWVQEILTRPPFNYTFGDPWTNATQYNNDLRDMYNTDWALIIFVADDTNDGDKCFKDGDFAWAYFGGPWMMTTYGNDGWGTEDLDLTIAHEAAHIFYVLDEYVEAGEPCDERTGYLNVENQNSRFGSCLLHVDCIMAETPYFSQSCYYTTAQAGHIDTDTDNIPDILDTFPTSTLNEYLPDPTTDDTPTYTGSTHVNPLPNQNPWGPGHDITLNTISMVQYRVDTGPWIDADPADSVFDSGVEDYTFTTGLLSAGAHTIQARAKNSEGNYEQLPYPFDTITILAPTYTNTAVPSSTPTATASPKPTYTKTATPSPTPTHTGLIVPIGGTTFTWCLLLVVLSLAVWWFTSMHIDI